MADLLYLYGFVPGASPPPPRALAGMHGRAVEAVPAGDVHAVVSRVPADAFAPDVIERSIEDLDWVGQRGLEHERVVAWYVDNAEILPASLFTLYSSATALVQDTVARSDELQSHLDRLHGQREWDLKVSYDHRQLAERAGEVIESVRDLDTEIAAAAAGRFLLEKRRSELIRHELGDAARASARTLLERLAEDAADVVALPIPRADAQPVVLNAALLVRREAEAAFLERAAGEIATLQMMGISAQLTGPWAPYRFLERHDGTPG